LRHLQDIEWVRSDRSRDADEFRHIESTLATLVLRDEGLWPSQSFGESGLRNVSGLSGAHQLLKRTIVRLRKKGAQGRPPVRSWHAKET
jgi:hypothetical protein